MAIIEDGRTWAERDGPAAAPAVRGEWEQVLARVASLSQREAETFRLLAGGASNRLIAARLQVTERTVKAHVAQILAKLDVESRLQAGIVAFACAALARNGEDLVLPGPPIALRRPAPPPVPLLVGPSSVARTAGGRGPRWVPAPAG
ncbi:MAG TPA: helix-turn-helix transcriptional regulator [Kineosporiaceae bacterium]